MPNHNGTHRFDGMMAETDSNSGVFVASRGHWALKDLDRT